jgi:hypothetical protein
LTEKQGQLVLDSLRSNENKKFIATKKYLEAISGSELEVVKFTDSEIWDDLISARDKLFLSSNTTLEDLAQFMVQNRSSHNQSLDSKIINDISVYIRDYSLVWTMYSGFYLEILKKKKIVNTKFGLIIEPWVHSRSNEAQILLNENLIESSVNNHYLNPAGINKNLGFIAISEYSSYNFKSTRVNNSINEIPNLLNYRGFIEKLGNSASIDNLDLTKNETFMLACNLFPYGMVKTYLNEMVEIANDYKSQKLKIKSNADNANGGCDFKRRIEITELKNQKSIQMKSISIKINEMLLGLLDNILS